MNAEPIQANKLAQWAQSRCACLHPDPYECMVLRCAGQMSRESAEQDARMFGGCECSCHGYEEDGNDEW